MLPILKFQEQISLSLFYTTFLSFQEHCYFSCSFKNNTTFPITLRTMLLFLLMQEKMLHFLLHFLRITFLITRKAKPYFLRLQEQMLLFLLLQEIMLHSSMASILQEQILVFSRFSRIKDTILLLQKQLLLFLLLKKKCFFFEKGKVSLLNYHFAIFTCITEFTRRCFHYQVTVMIL